MAMHGIHLYSLRGDFVLVTPSWHCIYTLLIIYLLLCVLSDSPPQDPCDSVPGCSIAPDSSTVCASSPATAPHPGLDEALASGPSQTPCTSSGSHTALSSVHAAVTSTSQGHLPATYAHHVGAAPLSPSPIQGQIPLSKSKLSSLSSPSLTLSSSPGPATAQAQASSLGPRRKGFPRKLRRNQRQRGRQSCTPAAREGERRARGVEDVRTGEEEKMEEYVEQDEERMEEETSGESTENQ